MTNQNIPESVPPAADTTTTASTKLNIRVHAVKTALTGREMLLPENEARAYEALMLKFQKQYQPVGVEEIALVQSLTDVVWRLDRYPSLEAALITLGRARAQKNDPAAFATTPSAVLEMQIRLTHKKDFRELALQERSLVRRRERELAELHALQTARKAKETEELTRAAKAALLAKAKSQPFNLAENGFVFSNERFQAHMASLTPAMKQSLLQEAMQNSEAAAA